MPKHIVMKFQNTRDTVSNSPSQEAIRLCAPARQKGGQKNTGDPGYRESSTMKISREDSHVIGLRQVDGGFWKDASRRKVEPSDYLMG